MPKVSRNPLRNYRTALHKCTQLFQCEICSQQFSAWDYTQHLYHVHSVPHSHVCPWYKCRIQGMTEDARHLRSCFERFLNDSVLKVENMTQPRQANRESSNTSETIVRHANHESSNTSETIVNSKVAKCPCIHFKSAHTRRKMMGRSRIEVSPHFYESFCEDTYLDSDWFDPSDRPGNTADKIAAIQNDQLMFSSESGLGSDAPMFIRKYIELKETTQWYHVMVRASAFNQFYEAIQSEQDHLGLLPFWCLCDGLSFSTRRKPKYIHHRHMILISSEVGEAFKRAWKRVQPSERSYKNERCKVFKPIESVFHLVNVIRYLGTPHSHCKGTSDSENGVVGMHHFYMNRPVCEHADRHLCTLWPGGLQSYFQKKFGNMNVDQWCDDVILNGTQWTLPIRVLCHNTFKCVVPYNHDFELDTIVPLSHFDSISAAGCLFFPNNLVMVLKINPNLPDGSEWFDYQMNHGNCMNDTIKDYTYTLSRAQQKSMNQVMSARQPLEGKIDLLNKQILDMSQKIETHEDHLRKNEIKISDLQSLLSQSTEQNRRLTLQQKTIAQEHKNEHLLDTIHQKDRELRLALLEKIEIRKENGHLLDTIHLKDRELRLALLEKIEIRNENGHLLDTIHQKDREIDTLKLALMEQIEQHF